MLVERGDLLRLGGGRYLAALLVVVAFAIPASGAMIWDFAQPPVDSPTIAEIQAAGGLIVGDKLFDDFRVTSVAVPGALAPDASAIAVTAVKVGDDYGLRFNGGWVAPAGQSANTTIKFHVAVVDPFLSQGWLLKDNALYMTAFGILPQSANGSISISENVYASDIDQGHSDPVANKMVYYISDSNKHLYDESDFLDSSGNLLTLSEIWVVKDIIVFGGPGSNGLAHLSEFFQTFSQVPEPAAIFVLACGSVMVIRRRRRAA